MSHAIGYCDEKKRKLQNIDNSNYFSHVLNRMWLKAYRRNF